MIKISILKDGDKYAYMETQSGNDPLVFNDTYGASGYWTLAEVCESVIATYGGMEIVVSLNLLDTQERKKI